MVALVAQTKRVLATGLLHSGALRIVRRFTLSRKAVVLMYHRVNDEASPFYPALRSAAFRRQLDYLTAAYRPDTFEGILEWFAEGAPGPSRMAVTVDDGYPDTHDVVLPELERRGIPATLFLSTQPPETGQALWIDQVSAMFEKTRAAAVQLAWLGEAARPLTTVPERVAAARAACGRMKRVPAAEHARRLHDLASALLEPGAPPLAGPPVITWDQVRRLAAGPVRIGGHTHRHLLVSTLDDDDLAREIGGAIDLIRTRVGCPVTTFAYPNGQPGDHDPRVYPLLEQAGIRGAVVAHGGAARPSDDRYAVPRFYTGEEYFPLFAARTAGLGRPEA